MLRSIVFRQLQCTQSNTFTYILGCPKTKRAVVIDPVLQNVDRDSALLNELGLKPQYSVETHVHADHITGGSALRERFDCAVVISRASGANNADVYVDDGDEIEAGTIALTAMATPGHTSGCMTFYAPSAASAFTGDALLIRGCGRTDFQQGALLLSL